MIAEVIPPELKKGAKRMLKGFVKCNAAIHNIDERALENHPGGYIVARADGGRLWWYGIYDSETRAREIAKAEGNGIVLDPTNQKGRWIHRNDDLSDWLECSECGHGADGEVPFEHDTPFCPYCGAAMQGVDE